MAQRIGASVGRGGVNRPADVKIIQYLLNKVGQQMGGPNTRLMVDGVCNAMTTEAIRKFQVRHLGAAGADGRVEPGGRTLAKLNDFDDDALDFPTLTTASVLRCPHGGTVTGVLAKVPTYMTNSGAADLSTTDPFLVAGCNFPTPCVRVRWVSSPALVLDIRSVGLCLNAAGIPQGPVLVAKP